MRDAGNFLAHREFPAAQWEPGDHTWESATRGHRQCLESGLELECNSDHQNALAHQSKPLALL